MNCMTVLRYGSNIFSEGDGKWYRKRWLGHWSYVTRSVEPFGENWMWLVPAFGEGIKEVPEEEER